MSLAPRITTLPAFALALLLPLLQAEDGRASQTGLTISEFMSAGGSTLLDSDGGRDTRDELAIGDCGLADLL